jgi:P4 family phage/plasmid primase-like protien
MDAMTSKPTDLVDFLKSCTIRKGDSKKITMTEFSPSSRRSFHVLEEDEELFEKLYYKEVIKQNKPNYLIQRQLIEKGLGSGGIFIDIDFRFSEDNKIRYYNDTHKKELVMMHLEAIEEICEMDEDVRFECIISEKPAPRIDIKENVAVVKDGIHIMINLLFDRETQLLLREKVIGKMKTKWISFPIVNKGGWEDVLDDSIPSGTNGWLLPNSRKPDDRSTYDISDVYEICYDIDEKKWSVESLMTSSNKEAIMAKYYRMLFPRFLTRPILLVKDSVLPNLEKFKIKTHILREHDNLSTFQSLSNEITPQMVMAISCKEELDICIDSFMASMNVNDYRLRDARDYVNILPDTYYGAGSYNKWIRVGFVLNNISTKLFLIWVEFSSKSSSFMYSDIVNMYGIWCGLQNKRNMGGLTEGSLKFWAKSENQELYTNVHKQSIRYHIDSTLDSHILKDIANVKKRGGIGCTDNAIAKVLAHAKKGEFKSASINTNIWYVFSDPKWMKDDSGTTIRRYISDTENGLAGLYYDMAIETLEKAHKHEQDSEEYKKLYTRGTKIMEIYMRLGNCTDKDKILKEAREELYDKDFLNKLDKNPNLLCCKNGVIDFENKCFRKGSPEDYVSLSTNTNNRVVDRHNDSAIISDFNKYLETVFPIPDLLDYAKRHLASLLTGLHDKRQFLHYYTGKGRNGKSMLVLLMETILGEYAGALDANFYTTERPKRGQSSPDLVNIIGKRIAVTSEVNEGEKMFAGPMKQLTSATDKISCRPLYGNQIEFVAQANPIICANYFLDVHSRDYGTWRRIRVIPFVSTFTENPVNDDPSNPYQFPLMANLTKKFDEWIEVVLGLLVEIAFETNGMVDICPTVKEASEKYQRGQDYLQEFIDTYVTKGSQEDTIKRSQLIQTFKIWYQETYTSKSNKNKELIEKMENVFGPQTKLTQTTVGWRGIYIRYEPNEEDDELAASTSSVDLNKL